MFLFSACSCHQCSPTGPKGLRFPVSTYKQTGMNSEQWGWKWNWLFILLHPNPAAGRPEKPTCSVARWGLYPLRLRNASHFAWQALVTWPFFFFATPHLTGSESKIFTEFLFSTAVQSPIFIKLSFIALGLPDLFVKARPRRERTTFPRWKRCSAHACMLRRFYGKVRGPCQKDCRV